jgi:hypothetical protein
VTLSQWKIQSVQTLEQKASERFMYLKGKRWQCNGETDITRKFIDKTVLQCFPHRICIHPPCYSIRTLGSSGVKRSLTQFITEVKNKRSYIDIPHVSSWRAHEFYWPSRNPGEQEHVARTCRRERHTYFLSYSLNKQQKTKLGRFRK